MLNNAIDRLTANWNFFRQNPVLSIEIAISLSYFSLFVQCLNDCESWAGLGADNLRGYHYFFFLFTKYEYAKDSGWAILNETIATLILDIEIQLLVNFDYRRLTDRQSTL